MTGRNEILAEFDVFTGFSSLAACDDETRRDADPPTVLVVITDAVIPLKSRDPRDQIFQFVGDLCTLVWRKTSIAI